MLKKLKQVDSPHIRRGEHSTLFMLDAVIALLPLYVMAYIYYGPRALILGGIGMVSALVSGYLCDLFIDGRINFSDISAAVTGLILPLMMPASIPYYVVLTATLFAVFAVKLPFGGTGYNMFNPAAAGFAFVSVCWPDKLFNYPTPMRQLPLNLVIDEAEITFSTSVSQLLSSGLVPNIDSIDFVMGDFAGPMGVTNALVLLSCAVYLILRKSIKWSVPFTFFATSALFVLLFPRVDTPNHLNVLYELCGSSIIFGGIFLLNDPVTIPKRNLSQVLYAFFGAIFAMLFQYYGAFAQGVPFAIIIINVFAPLLDRYTEALLQKIRRKRLERTQNL
ncbi:MAG: RnfABCDGE type electron transport complex subunit D [Oscillospiraceae bacterium]|nr:RnfABCDGE type electron transport complex subunit D [Oscillospiraceae bacterium]